MAVMAKDADQREKEPVLPHKYSPGRTPAKLDTIFLARHVLTAMIMLGLCVCYCLRVSVSVALVAMVNATSSQTEGDGDVPECPQSVGPGNQTFLEPAGEFDWDRKTQGQVLGAFYFGYIFTQLPGGWLAQRLGGKMILGVGVLGSSLLTLLTPAAARLGVHYVMAARVMAGLCEGVMVPATIAMLGVWVPVYERSKLGVFTWSGMQLGTVIAMPVSGILCRHGLMGGWPSVFYVFGTAGCVWFVFWMSLAFDTPAQHPRISASERDYIQKSIGRKENTATPWRSILTSPAVWATLVAHCSVNWGLVGMLNGIPAYIKNILHFNIQQDGFLCAVPYLVMWLTTLTSGALADHLREHGYLSTAATRKTMQLVGSLTTSVLLVATGYTGCSQSLAVVLLSLGVGGSGILNAGYNFNYLDIAPRYAGSITGFASSVSSAVSCLSSGVLGLIINEHNTSREWLVYLYLTAGMYMAGAVVFLLFARGEVQPWAQGSPLTLDSAALIRHETTSDKRAGYGILMDETMQSRDEN